MEWSELTDELMGKSKFPQQYNQSPPQCSCAELRHPKSELPCNVCLSPATDPFCGVGEEEGEPLSAEEIRRINKQLGMIHRNTGHGSVDNLVHALKVRNSDPRVIELAKRFRCSVCEEHRKFVGRPKSNLEPLPPKWQCIQADVAHWTHPTTGEKYQFAVIIDEGCRFRIAKVVCQGAGQSAKGRHLIDMFQQMWKPVFGIPDQIRLDPAGPWRSEEVLQYFADQNVFVDTIPAEAHWMISHVERAIQSTKHVMSRLVGAEPDLSAEELLAEAVRVENEKEQVRGFSPAQHALGRSPEVSGKLHVSTLSDLPPGLCENSDGEFQRNLERMKVAEQAFTEWVYDDRVKRARNSRAQRQAVYSPGDMVYVWRVQTRGPAASARSGGFTGPARILALETRLDDEGNYRPGSVVWLVRGSRLIKAAPQQLRRASVREQCLEEIQNPPNLPWTTTKLAEALGPRQYEDVTDDIPTEMEWEQGQDEETQTERKRVTGKRRAPEYPVRLPHQNVRYMPVEGPAEARPIPVDDDDDDLMVDDPVYMSCPPEFVDTDAQCFWSSHNPAVEISIETPESKRGKKYMAEHFHSFLASNLKRRSVEVSEKHMSEQELAEMKVAKQVEVKKFLGAEALECLPPHLQPDRDTAMRMRWVLTWKRDEVTDTRSAKARCVILGYLDPMYAHRQTAAPTMSRTTRQLFLSIAAALKHKVYKGDVSGAFLQGRDYQGTAYVIPTDEICDGMGIPSGSVTKLRKACYGLVDAPLEWFLTVSDYLTSIGFTRCVSDPCCFRYVHENKLVGLVCGHVDDFLFSGPEDCEIWTSLCQKIKDRFKWGTWETKEFTQCGVLIRETAEGGFELSQGQYIDDLKEMPISCERRKTPESPTTEREKSKLRAVLGGLSWCAQQTNPMLSAAVNLLLSQVNSSKVSTLIEANKWVYQTKANRKHKIIIHGNIPLSQSLVACWTDAACQNRVDGKSTQGLIVGLTSKALLSGEMCKITPISWHSSKISRQCRSPGASESLAAIDGEDLLYAVRLQFREMCGHTINVRRTGSDVAAVPAVLVTDSTNVYDRLQNEVYVPKGPERRVALEMVGLKQGIVETGLEMRWVHSDAQLANSLTKSTELQQLKKFFELQQQWKIVEDEQMMSAKKRKKLGLETFETTGPGGHVISWTIHTQPCWCFISYSGPIAQ